MRNKMTSAPPEVALNRVLAGLEKELVEASDAEIELAAQDLGMNVRMKGSAAFIGVTYTFPKRFEDIFDVQRSFFQDLLDAQRSSLLKGKRKDRDDEGET
jgi:hypothetical protein